MKLPVRIQADAAGQPVMFGDYYYILDADNTTVLAVPLTSQEGCLGTVDLARRIVRLLNTEAVTQQALSGLVELGTGLLNDMGGCDHAVGICQCQDQALVEQGRMVMKRLDAKRWPGDQRGADLFTDIKEVLGELIEILPGPNLDTYSRAKQLLTELRQVQP